MGSKSRSTSKSQSSSQQQSFVDPQQQPFLQNLRSQAQSLQQSQQAPLGQAAFDLGGQLSQTGQQGITNIGNIQQALGGELPGFGATADAQQALRQQAFGENPELQNQINLLGQDIGQTFQQQILPGIQSEAIGTGQLGGGREGVAQGLASQAALSEFQRGAQTFRSEDITRQLAAAGQLGQLGLGQQAQTGAQLGDAGALNLGALGELQNLFNLGLSPFAAEFGALNNLAGIIGQPTVLQQGAAQATGEAASKGFGLFNFFGPSGGSASSSGGGSGS